LNLDDVASNVHAAALSLGTLVVNEGPDGLVSKRGAEENWMPPAARRSAAPPPCETAPWLEFISASSSFTRAVRSTGVGLLFTGFPLSVLVGPLESFEQAATARAASITRTVEERIKRLRGGVSS
jgi:hypothetical protein